jgi:hypothetical protein
MKSLILKSILNQLQQNVWIIYFIPAIMFKLKLHIFEQVVVPQQGIALQFLVFNQSFQKLFFLLHTIQLFHQKLRLLALGIHE